MAQPIANATGNIYYALADSTTLFFADPTSTGSPSYTAATNVTASAFLAPAVQQGPAKSSIVDRLAIAVGFTTGIVGYKDISSLDLSSKEGVTFFIRASTAQAAGVLQFCLDDTAAIASPIETIDIPALTANTWHRVCLKINDPSLCTAIISLGLKASSDPGTVNVDIYQPRYIEEFEGRKSFSITQNVDALDSTDYQSVGSREFKSGLSNWTATIEGHKEGAPLLVKNSEYVLCFAESNTSGQAFVGNGFYSSFTPAGNFADLVQYPYTIQGTGYLHTPQA